ncbi:Clavaminate synthase-like protein [Pholiota conissans]|uniref:Clavaminate synthase-like protein n=1 Tax=Pholiota conissans TaxID=109636 RepID=A0A9P5ZBL2_9AGAR|nr:Clavaminate synthase-like protein [Pholiota conissans]
MDLAHQRMKTANSPFALAASRAIYVDSCILRGLAQSILSDCLAAVATFDHAIIIAGASGKQYDLIMLIIRKIQSSLPKAAIFNTGLSYDTRDMHSTPDTSQDTIPCLNPPSFSAFQSNYSQAPFILRNYARNWPALDDHPWKSALYLRSVAGPGRVVPVEIGHDYRLADWKQDLVSWDDFISTLDFEDQPSSRTNENLLYMAQHDLTSQFPALRKDIIVPDYVYASLSSKNFATYSPPNNADQIILNAWLGPKGTMSPAHIDPYYNCYVQVVGFKSVWLAPPSMSSSMYPFGNSSNDETNRLPSSELNNTSKVDVFADPVFLNDYPDFVLRTIPNAMTATLGPGDMLFFPPGWWHAMKSNSTSFSISIWF